jgi:transposase
MATIQAARYNEHLKDVYQKLRKQGKAHKVAIIACVRKLLVHLNTIVKADGHVEATLASTSGSTP